MPKKDPSSSGAHHLDDVKVDTIVTGKDAVDPTLPPPAVDERMLVTVFAATQIPKKMRTAFVAWLAQHKIQATDFHPLEALKQRYDEFTKAMPKK